MVSKWNRFVDLVTVVWLGLFFANLAFQLGEAAGIVLLALLPVYVADLGVKYRQVRNFKRFLREHWLSILMTIPYLRVLRILRLFRLLRFLRLMRVTRVGRWPGTIKLVGALRRIKRLWPRTRGA